MYPSLPTMSHSAMRLHVQEKLSSRIELKKLKKAAEKPFGAQFWINLV